MADAWEVFHAWFMGSDDRERNPFLPDQTDANRAFAEAARRLLDPMPLRRTSRFGRRHRVVV